jgi:hypothetical protein
MAKNIEATKRKVVNGLTAATFSTNGKKGKPSRPKGMSNEEWWKVLANGRVPKVLKGMRGIARLATVEGYSEKQVARILRDLQTHMEMINNAFANPEKPVKSIAQRYFV